MGRDKPVNRPQKPELLLPAGSPEAFIAALEGGADAVYLGLQQFNARGRARNFRPEHFPALLAFARKYDARIYLTLNTLIKNNELPAVLDLLDTLRPTPPAALIIQDWGVYQLCRQWFSRYHLHASTQMGNHNALDCAFASSMGFERIILARELSLDDICTISSGCNAELEVFAHGALCYSFSGSCLFSSYTGGMSANRGLCRQPCRHLYQNEVGGEERFFSLKDLQLIDYLPQLTRLGIKAIKIEGRMRSAAYVYRVAKAYRMALDFPDRIKEAKALLIDEGGRDKTTWFFEGKSRFATTGNAFTGTAAAHVVHVGKEIVKLEVISPLSVGDNVRFATADDMDSQAFTLREGFAVGDISSLQNTVSPGQIITIPLNGQKVSVGDILFKLPQSDLKLPTLRLNSNKLPTPNRMKQRSIMAEIANTVFTKPSATRPSFYFRINDPAWLPLLKQHHNAGVLLPVDKVRPDESAPHLIAELPFFLTPATLSHIHRKVQNLLKAGHHKFALSRLSQLDWFKGKSVHLTTNEHIYLLNDAAILLVQSLPVKNWILPLENDFPNLLLSKNRQGIVPLYFHPALFYSRQTIFEGKDTPLTHSDQELMYHEQDGMVTVYPHHPVCNFSFYPRLLEKGYSRFLIDLSHHKADKKLLDSLMQHLSEGKNLPDTSRFNMKKGLH